MDRHTHLSDEFFSGFPENDFSLDEHQGLLDGSAFDWYGIGHGAVDGLPNEIYTPGITEASFSNSYR